MESSGVIIITDKDNNNSPSSSHVQQKHEPSQQVIQLCQDERRNSTSTGTSGYNHHYTAFPDDDDVEKTTSVPQQQQQQQQPSPLNIEKKNHSFTETKMTTWFPQQWGGGGGVMFVQGCYIGFFAILGVVIRIFFSQFFGDTTCMNPGSVGWLPAGSPLCIRSDGQTIQVGGILFADLPANLIGSFFMGFAQDYTVLQLAIPMAIAWLPALTS